MIERKAKLKLICHLLELWGHANGYGDLLSGMIKVKDLKGGAVEFGIRGESLKLQVKAGDITSAEIREAIDEYFW